ncbi:MAG: thermonuclease family protein [Rhodospirillales bacterium]|nr:thermonuclease family protein [Rhodospirillales bacterium]
MTFARFLLVIGTLLAVVPTVASADTIVGRASVIDGNTLEINGTRIRLYGIDAPESAQICAVSGKQSRCGQLAAKALADRIGQQTVTCDPKGRDQDGVVVAMCSAGGEDLNAWMVSQGMALAYRLHSTKYVRREKRAAKEKAGIWRGWFVKPWDWRRGRRLTTERVFEEGACAIKGNITRDGKRIYHIPGGQYYDGARIDTPLGEHWFCSEAEARAAGWRKSKR